MMVEPFFIWSDNINKTKKIMRVLLDLKPTCVSSCKRQNLESESNKEERKKDSENPMQNIPKHLPYS